MRKQFKLHLLIIIALLSMLMVLPACKKSKEQVKVSAPDAETSIAVNVSMTWASLEGVANANNQTTIVTFEYDTTTSYKHIIDAIPDTLTVNVNTGETAYISGLKENTKYHFRIKAINASGTTYGRDTTFTTARTGSSKIIFNPCLTYGSAADNDGNTYKTIQIGSQKWMAENLKTTRYNDGTAIPLIIGMLDWNESDAPGYCWYTNDSVSYGALYNFYTVNTGKLCPLGWRVPSDADWNALISQLGGESVAGNKQKETGLNHWQTPNTGATNESGFTALPGGYRRTDGTYINLKKNGYWWSSTESSSVNAFYRLLFFDSGFAERVNSDKRNGFSVRCLLDNNN